VTAFGTTNPSIHSGNGFTVVRVDRGVYLIDFKDGLFNDTPALVATQQYSGNSNWNDFSSVGGNTKDNVTIIALDRIHAKLKTGDNDGNQQDRNFSFIAIGD